LNWLQNCLATKALQTKVVDLDLKRIEIEYKISSSLKHQPVVASPHIDKAVLEDIAVRIFGLQLRPAEHFEAGSGESGSNYTRNEIILVQVQNNINKYCKCLYFAGAGIRVNKHGWREGKIHRLIG
jgi:hypothetical protein